MGDAIFGVLSKAAIGAETSAWGTEASAYELIQFVSESLSEVPESVYLNAMGASGQKPSEKGMIVVTGDIVLKGDYYNALDIILEAAMGLKTETAPPPARPWIYSLTDELTQSLSLKIEKQDTGKLWTYLGCKVASMKISGNAKDQILLITLTLIAKSKTVTTASISETFTDESLVLMSQLTARLADRADALAGGDEIPISDFELTLDNTLKGDDVIGGSNNILEPIRSGHRKVTLTLTIPRADDTYASYQQNRTPLQADLSFTDATKTLLLEISYIILIDGGDIPISGPEIIPASLTFDCFLNSTAIMGDVDEEFEATVT